MSANENYDALMAKLLKVSIIYLARATTPAAGQSERPELVVEDALLANYAGAAAWLLDEVRHLDPSHAEVVAGKLDELMDMGEPLAEWVGEVAADRYGIDVDALIAEHLGKRS